ncbi:MAG: RNA methyltransferase [Gemmatimonadales bacterium]|jgi:TrmH family RNA methyltransferase
MISRAQAKLVRKLKSRKQREEAGAFLAEGVRLVEDLLASGWEVDLVVTSPGLVRSPRGRRLFEAIERGGWARSEVSDAELADLADTETPQGVLAVARRPHRRLSEFEPGAQAAILVFDRVADPGNLGTLLRAAYALGVDWTIALPGTVDPWNAKSVRASAGALFRLPISQERWSEVSAWLKERAFTILCADPGGEVVLRSGEPVGRFALVLGNEPLGLSDEVRESCGRRVAVELPGNMDSLNVAIAGALLLDRLLTAQTRRSD